jgi:hypothetical protein
MQKYFDLIERLRDMSLEELKKEHNQNHQVLQLHNKINWALSFEIHFRKLQEDIAVAKAKRLNG